MIASYETQTPTEATSLPIQLQEHPFLSVNYRKQNIVGESEPRVKRFPTCECHKGELSLNGPWGFDATINFHQSIR